MNELVKQFSGLFGAGIAAACCLGVSAVLAAMGAVGLGFLVHDAYLFPIFVGFVGFSLWQLFRSARNHENLAPFWFALIGGLFASAGLWLLVTSIYPANWPMIVGLTALVAGSVWDFINGRKSSHCATARETAPVDTSRRAINSAALAIAAGGIFYGLYKSVDMLAPKADANEIACYGINACKGQTSCSSAFNSCNGQNACKGKGWLNATAEECALKGGVPLKGSPADPENA
jgi:MerC mercury resistance protein